MRVSDGFGADLTENGALLPLAEDFYTVQGEGRNTGKAAYFIRLAGCDVGCRWCDARFTWNARSFPLVQAGEIAARAMFSGTRTAVITGGEPLMHPLEPLTRRLRDSGMEVCIETSGAHPLSGSFDWICLSPKRQSPPLGEVCIAADELKVVISGKEDFLWAEECAARVSDSCLLYLQPEWGVYNKVIGEIVDYVKFHPRWLVSLQTHKFMDIP